MSNNILIDDASYSDLDFIIKGIKEVCKIERQEPEKDKVLIKITKIAIKNNRIRVVKKDNKTLGFVQFTFSSKEPYGLEYGEREKYCWIEWMYVSKENQRKGLGKALYQDLIKICKKNKVNEIMLDVFEVNKKARDFYQKENFKNFIHILRRKF